MRFRTLEEPRNRDSHGGALEVTSSPDMRYVFVSVEVVRDQRTGRERTQTCPSSARLPR